MTEQTGGQATRPLSRAAKPASSKYYKLPTFHTIAIYEHSYWTWLEAGSTAAVVGATSRGRMHKMQPRCETFFQLN